MHRKRGKKYDFIVKLLKNKKLSKDQTKRILLLTRKEVSKDKTLKRQLLKNELDNEDELLKTPIKEKKYPIKPEDTADFMALFNKREGLKYLTHDFDEPEGFKFDEEWDRMKSVFTENTKKNNLRIPKSLWAITNNFAFKKEPWTSIDENFNDKDIRQGWASPVWEIWSKENKLHPIRNDEFKEVINDFRRITRIDAPNLETIIDLSIQKILGKNGGGFNVKKEDLKKADFYTHVKRFKNSFETILKEIKQRAGHNKVNIDISYQRDRDDQGGYFLRKIIIMHHNSFPNKGLDVLAKEWTERNKGSMGGISNNLEGYCYWSVETKFDEGPYRINILKKPDIQEAEKIEDASEFKHILTFYYK